MAGPNWAALFDEAYPEPGLPAQYLADGVIEGYLFEPLTADEQAEVRNRQVNPFPESDPLAATWKPFDPAGWLLPADRILPPSYKAFLGWSNGGTFVTGDREFQMLKAQELREYLLLYDVPQYLSGAVPFALNGGGYFYLFDLREPPDGRGEYPILFAPTGSLRPETALVLGRSFEEVLRDGRNPEEL